MCETCCKRRHRTRDTTMFGGRIVVISFLRRPDSRPTLASSLLVLVALFMKGC
jgi:hypothetical protein